MMHSKYWGKKIILCKTDLHKQKTFHKKKKKKKLRLSITTRPPLPEMQNVVLQTEMKGC